MYLQVGNKLITYSQAGYRLGAAGFKCRRMPGSTGIIRGI